MVEWYRDRYTVVNFDVWLLCLLSTSFISSINRVCQERSQQPTIIARCSQVLVTFYQITKTHGILYFVSYLSIQLTTWKIEEIVRYFTLSMLKCFLVYRGQCVSHTYRITPIQVLPTLHTLMSGNDHFFLKEPELQCLVKASLALL